MLFPKHCGSVSCRSDRLVQLGVKQVVLPPSGALLGSTPLLLLVVAAVLAQLGPAVDDGSSRAERDGRGYVVMGTELNSSHRSNLTQVHSIAQKTPQAA